MRRSPCCNSTVSPTLFIVVLLAATGVAGSGRAAEPAGGAASMPAESPQDVQPLRMQAEGVPGVTDLDSRDQLLGEMAGLRPWLRGRGMSLELVSTDEGFANPKGGAGRATPARYAGLTDMVLTLDTGDAGWWPGGRLVVGLQNIRGDDISESVGDLQGVSNIVGPSGTSIAEVHLVQELAHGRLVFKLGKQDANADFVISDGGNELVNSSFGIIPTVPLPTFPEPTPGVMVAWRPTARARLKAGVWQGPEVGGEDAAAAGIDCSGGTVAAFGLELQDLLGERILPGTYRVGAWRHSRVAVATEIEKAAAAGFEVGPAHGLYFSIDQQMWRGGGSRSLALFAQGGWGETGSAAVCRYLGAGLILASPVATRPADRLGVAVAHAEIGLAGRSCPQCSSETVLELFYSLPISAWMTLQPDLQVVHRPGGVNGRTAWVAGMRVTTVF